MSSVQVLDLVLLLLALVIPLELLARRLRLPPAAALILGGMALALIPGLPEVKLDPDLTLVLFLPPLLQSSAFFTVWRDFWANRRTIFQLAVGAVLFTTFVVGVVAHTMLPWLPWAACFALGAILSPPDAVSAKAVLARVVLPARMTVQLEGESLVNDASGLVLFRFAVAAALTGTFSAGHAAASFVLVAAGGVLVGYAMGHATCWVIRRLGDTTLVVVGTFLSGWAAYIAADEIGTSGVLATVTCGLVMGWQQHEIITAVARTQARAVWGVVVFVLESLVFILIGLSLRGLVVRLGGRPDVLLGVLPAIAAVVLAVVLTRFVWVFAAAYLPRLVVPALRRLEPRPPPSVPLIMSWAGMRGVVSLAAALSLPASMPGRDFILVTTFAVILVTVLGQGATLAPLIRRVSFRRYAPHVVETVSEHAARARLAEVQLAAVTAGARDGGGALIHPKLLQQFEYRAAATQRMNESNGSLMKERDAHFGLVLAAVAAGRAELVRMHHEGHVHDTVLRTLENELDLEEMTARRLLGEVTV